MTLATSTTALTSGNDCASLTYATSSDLCTITGTNKSCSWTPAVFATPVPNGGCIQVHATCTGGTCTTWASNGAGPNFGLDCSTSATSPYTAGAAAYESAGSGAFDTDHVFGAGPWGIADALWPFYPESQHYWVAPPNGLYSCGAVFSFANAIVGSGSFSFAFSVSDTALSAKQSCVDLTYSDTPALGALAVGAKSVLVPQTAVTIPGTHCFAVHAIVASGAPSAITIPANQFNWMAYCSENAAADPTATPTPTQPTATATAITTPTTNETPCVGDCSGSGVVSISNLILGVNIALGKQPSTACPPFQDSQGQVTIAQLIEGVTNALRGCGGG